MGYIYKNITGNTAIDLEVRDIENNKYKLSTMTLCNTHATDSVSVNLYLNKIEGTDARSSVGDSGDWNPLETTNTSYYILNNIVMPNGSTLLLDSSYLKFDRSMYKLYIKLSASDSAVDIILN
tara:strand:- start:21 stop:389 length:369 start_codon:yes stop_codon:yes gene_type:complete